MTDFYEVPMCVFGTKEELGRCIGKEFRASMAITDENLANAIEKKLLAYRNSQPQAELLRKMYRCAFGTMYKCE